jgi:wobble nucleotide-excising tRNase
MSILEWWRETLLGLGTLYVIITERRLKKAQADTEVAKAAQEQIKVKQEEVSLSLMVQEVYQKLNKDVLERIDELEKKYEDILLKNGVLEEKANDYEQKYETLKRENVKLKLDYNKVHAENKEIRKELDQLRNSTHNE